MSRKRTNPMTDRVKRLVAPRGWDAATRKVFKQVVASKPATYFERSDLPSLEEYCSLKSDIDSYKKTLAEEGRFYVDSRGVKRANPALTALSGARSAFLAAGSKLKLDKRSRESGLTKAKVHKEAAEKELVERSGKRKAGLMYIPGGKKG